MKQLFPIALSAVLITACTTWQPEPAPALETAKADAWTDALKEAVPAGDERRQPFWRRSEDDTLMALIGRVETANPDLEEVRARLAEARAIERADRAGLGPRVETDAQVTAQRQSETGQIPVGRIPGYETEQVLYEAGFDASWELDLFGRKDTQRALSAARTALAEERLSGARFSLEAEAARAYVDTIAARLTLEALTRAAARQNDIFEGVAVRRAHGEASDFDVERVSGQLAEYEARFAPAEQDLAIARYRLARLTGQAPSAFDADLPEELPDPDPVRLDFSSDVLRQRSDVREAELAYVRAARESELAELDLYPRFTLFGGGGPSTTELSDFLDPASLALNLGAMVDWTLYDGGRREAQADAAEARLIQAQARYRSTVLSAMEEIEAAAVRYLKTGEQLDKRETVTASRARIAEMAGKRLEGGTGTLIEVLETERDLAEAELSEARVRAALLTARIALEKALGPHGAVER